MKKIYTADSAEDTEMRSQRALRQINARRIECEIGMFTS